MREFSLREWLGALLTHLHLNRNLGGVASSHSGELAEIHVSDRLHAEPNAAVLLERWADSMAGVESVKVENCPEYVRLTVTGELCTGYRAVVWTTYRGEHGPALVAAAEDQILDLATFRRIITASAVTE